MNKQILFVDTNFENQLLMGRIIQHAGYVGHSAADLPQAESLTREHDYALLLLTITAETAAEAFAFVRKLKTQAEQTAVIALLHHKDNHLTEQAFLAGCDGHFAKPADIRQIQTLLDELMVETAVAPQETTLVAAD